MGSMLYLGWKLGERHADRIWNEMTKHMGTYDEMNARREGWPSKMSPDYPIDGPHRRVPRFQPGWLGTYGETLEESEEKMARIKPREGNVKILPIDVGKYTFIMHRGVPLDPAIESKFVVNTKDTERMVMHLRDLADKLEPPKAQQKASTGTDVNG